MKKFITFNKYNYTGYLFALMVICFSSCGEEDEGVGERLEQSMGLYTTSASLNLGDEITIAPKFAPGVTPKRTYEWTADNPDIVSMVVDENYAVTLTALSEGTTNLTITSADGVLSRSCPVRIFDGKAGINVSFGPGSNGSFSDGWNLLSSILDGGMISNLKTSTGYGTGIAINVTGRFNQTGSTGESETDTELEMPEHVSSGYFLGNSWTVFQGVITEQSTLTLEGLDSDKRYNFYFFGSRAAYTDYRSARYSVRGANEGADDLNGSGNSSELAYVTGIQPNENGEIFITIQASEENSSKQGFYYLNAMRFAVAEEVK
ncbi:pilus assembly protein N-terminal domain-containing protein [Sinomicrobium soli]|uniref:pilus assembly protein N-terminal domain-containing protein n=1 Tax=Sinomicrobium sp. N-1-3-6 TaxID=2219864 RepID=UPI001374B3AF|nr:pilus assembly protein N-terminal domain-containing protein [Sinomicrobium sp. N-1-3-6]